MNMIIKFKNKFKNYKIRKFYNKIIKYNNRKKKFNNIKIKFKHLKETLFNGRSKFKIGKKCNKNNLILMKKKIF